MTKAGRDRKEQYQWEARAQWRGKPLEGDIAVDIALYFGTKRRADPDNFNKLSLHALTGIVWQDDSQIADLRLPAPTTSRSRALKSRCTEPWPGPGRLRRRRRTRNGLGRNGLRGLARCRNPHLLYRASWSVVVAGGSPSSQAWPSATLFQPSARRAKRFFIGSLRADAAISSQFFAFLEGLSSPPYVPPSMTRRIGGAGEGRRRGR
jgi:hypothetical protein